MTKSIIVKQPTGAKAPTRAERALAAFSAWAAYGTEKTGAPVDLAKVARLARRQLELEAAVEAAVTALKAANQALFDVRCLALPETLADAGLLDITLSTGEKVTIKSEYSASLSGKYKEPALAWLKAQGFGDLIRFEVVVSFGTGQGKAVKVLEKLLGKLKLDKKLKPDFEVAAGEAVNTGSFKALIREQLEAGLSIPVEELGITVLDAAKITVPKEKQTI